MRSYISIYVYTYIYSHPLISTPLTIKRKLIDIIPYQTLRHRTNPEKTPKKYHLFGHLSPISQTIQVRRTTHTWHSWRSKNELTNDFLWGLLGMDTPVLPDKQILKLSISVRTLGAVRGPTRSNDWVKASETRRNQRNPCCRLALNVVMILTTLKPYN